MNKAARLAAFTALILMLTGCTAMLLGGGGTAGPARNSGGSAQASADAAITTAVRDRLRGDSMLGRYDLAVETLHRNVTLRGTVGSHEARQRAIRLAGEVAGVARVDSRIVVGSGT